MIKLEKQCLETNYIYIFNLNNTIQNYRRHWIHHVERMELQCIPKQLMDLEVGNIITDYKPILKYVIFGLFYFHHTTCFHLSRSSYI
jgi:hypothetical protein